MKTEVPGTQAQIPNNAELWMRIQIRGRAVQFLWSEDGQRYREFGSAFDTTKPRT